jgi:hypothetical protein
MISKLPPENDHVHFTTTSRELATTALPRELDSSREVE